MWLGSEPAIQNGTSRRLPRSWAKGSCGTSSGAKTAQIAAMATTTAPIQVLTLRQPRLGPADTEVTLMRRDSWTAQPGVEHRVHEVGQHGEGDVDHRQHQHDRLHDREVVLADALPGKEADAVQGEDLLDHDRAAQYEAELHGG